MQKRGKRGLSTVITTLILVLLVLIAIGIIWVVIRGVLERGTGQFEPLTECNFLDVDINQVSNCNTDSCQVQVERKAGGTDFEGLIFSVTDGLSSAILDGDDYSEDGALDEFVVRTFNLNYATNPLASIPTEVTVTPYYLLNGEIRPCQTAESFIVGGSGVTYLFLIASVVEGSTDGGITSIISTNDLGISPSTTYTDEYKLKFTSGSCNTEEYFITTVDTTGTDIIIDPPSVCGFTPGDSFEVSEKQ